MSFGGASPYRHEAADTKVRGNSLRNTRSVVRASVPFITGLLLVSALGAPSSAYPRPGRTEWLSPVIVSGGANTCADPAGSTTVDGERIISPAGDHKHVDISSNGRFVVFVSTHRHPASGPVLPCEVFVFDRQEKTTHLVSKSTSGLATPFHSYTVSISGNGRRVAFVSNSPALVSGDTNLAADVFVHDLKEGWTRRVSVASDGSETRPTVYSEGPSISDDGRYVAFASGADNLVPNDTDGTIDVFVHDLNKSETEVVSGLGDSPSGGSYPTITGGGRYVAYHGVSFGPAETEKWACSIRVFVRDRRARRTRTIASARAAIPRRDSCGLGTAPSPPGARSISEDGRYTVFVSSSPDIVPNDTDVESTILRLPSRDAFVHDAKTGRIERVSVRHDGGEGRGHLHTATISPNGRYVAFLGYHREMFEGDTGVGDSLGLGDPDVFVHDRVSGGLEWITSTPEGEESFCGASGGQSDARVGGLSRDGRFVSFLSCARGLDPTRDDPDGQWSAFVRDRGLPLVSAFADGEAPEEPTGAPDEAVCIEGVCIPPGAAVTSFDDVDDLNMFLTDQGANLYGATLAHRPQFKDLFAVIELEHMPKVIPGASPIFYGLRFEIHDRKYEVRATSPNFGTFGLFECAQVCTKIADLRGGYGTTGMRVVFSLPLAEVGIETGGKLKDVTAFSALGNDLTGASKVLDSVRIR